MANKKRRYVTEDNEANPYFDSFDYGEEEEEKEYDDVSDVPEYHGLSDEDLKLREGETEKERMERLKLAELNSRQLVKERKNRVRTKKLVLDTKNKISIAISVLIGTLILQLGNYYIYTTQVKYPDEMIIDENLTGRKCLAEWESFLKARNGVIADYIETDSYLELEDTYANANETRIKFFQAMVDTVDYVPEKVEKLNKYGNYFVDKNSKSVVFEESIVSLDEDVDLNYVDYDSVPIDTNEIKKMMKVEGIKLGDAGYSDKLTDIFCNYMLNLVRDKKLPVKSEKRKPAMGLNYDRSYYIKAEEDVFLDKLLFSSDAFYNLLERFSLAAASNSKNPAWEIWNNYTEEQKNDILNNTWDSSLSNFFEGKGLGEAESESDSETETELANSDWLMVVIPSLDAEMETETEIITEAVEAFEAQTELISNFDVPTEYITELQPTKEWITWNSNPQKKEADEPEKYETGYVIPHTWCGSYFLQNEYVEYDENGNAIPKKIPAPLGDGTAGNPASLGTTVITSVNEYTYDRDGNRVNIEGGEVYPISIKMVEYGVSQEALDWFDSKDERNRGIDIDSEVQYFYCVFEVTNLSDKVIAVADEMSLCDRNVNLFMRTGTIFGLTDEVKLRPNETGRIETWGGATDLNKKYIIWGKTFARAKDVIWFRKLAGDLEDTSVDKGVDLNRTRYGEDRGEEE